MESYSLCGMGMWGLLKVDGAAGTLKKNHLASQAPLAPKTPLSVHSSET